MIKIVEAADRDTNVEYIDQMHRMRAEVFADRLGWDVTVNNGREADRFDDEDPAYLLAIDDRTGTLNGAVRLLPTTGPNMLRDVFSVLVPDGAPESPLIWESSRFAIKPAINKAAHVDANFVVNRMTVELLCGIVEVCRSAGIAQVVSVFDARMARIFRAVGCPFTPIGRPTRIGSVMTYAGIFDMTDELRAKLGRAGGFNGRVIP
ncbi:acyl-homoserine-lactone synthase [Devosia sp. LjRoot3]|uniref:acyl-homoserine-lactone synthase n=1 Tax=Devosia sp. LjRoot3 TaxID=3342319 RepID=UPI003ECCF7CE